MDIDACLSELLRLADDLLDTEEGDATVIRCAELVKALDGWLSQGGCLPRKWRL